MSEAANSMWNERFDRIDHELTAVKEHLTGLDEHRRLAENQFAVIDSRLDGIDRRLDGVDVRLDNLETGQRELRTEMRGGFADLRTHMGVLHEDGIARLKAMPERDVPTRSEVNEALAACREDTDRRLDPLEAIVREHSKQLGQPKRRRG
jgi:chromosome segregation ATPase